MPVVEGWAVILTSDPSNRTLIEMWETKIRIPFAQDVHTDEHQSAAYLALKDWFLT